MSLDLIALVVMTAFVGLGAWRGALASGAGVVTLAASYAAAILGAQAMGDSLGRSMGMPGVLGPVAAGSICFLAAFALCSVVTWGLRRWDRGRRDGLPRSVFDRIGGAFFGAVRGGLVVLLLTLLLSWLDAARDIGVIEGAEGLPDTESSRVGEATSRLIESAVESALSAADTDAAPSVRMVARIAARPGESLESFQAVVEDERVRALSGDRVFWTLVENGASESAINQASFYQIVHDAELRERMADLGLVPPEAVEDPEVFRRAAAAVLAEIGPRLQNLRNDPELQKLADDPDILAMVESGDTFALLTHPDVQRIMERVSAD